jgi:hypothetical protein
MRKSKAYKERRDLRIVADILRPLIIMQLEGEEITVSDVRRRIDRRIGKISNLTRTRAHELIFTDRWTIVKRERIDFRVYFTLEAILLI